jgi:hypothetical protein
VQVVDHRIDTIASSFILFSSPSNTAREDRMDREAGGQGVGASYEQIVAVQDREEAEGCLCYES